MTIDGIPLVELGPPALVAIFVLLVFTGRLVPRKQHEEELAARDKVTADARAERDEWRDTAQKTLLANQEERAQKRELLEAMRTANRFIEATTKAAGVNPEAKP